MEEKNTSNERDVVNNIGTSKIVSKKNKKKKYKKFLTIGIVLIVLILVFYSFMNKNNKAVNMMSNIDYSTQPVTRNDIKVTLTGSGTLKPANSYTVTTLISGEILNAPFEEGDIVEEDTVLYEIDSSDAKTNLEKAELNVSQSKKSYDRLLESLDDLNVKASDSGTVVNIDVKKGDSVQPGQVLATIRNSDTMSITLAFSSDDVEDFYVGQSATLTVEGTYEDINGTISSIKNVEEVIDGYKLVKRVTINVKNPGGLSTSDKATAVINNTACVESSNFTYITEEDIKASISGDVVSIKVDEGDSVSKGQLMVVLESTTINDNIDSSERNLRDAELSLENQYENLDEYTFKSPISGTIIEKNYKVGDKLESGKNLCTIFDLSYLTMTLNVDELDISQIVVGQKVNITAEAVENKTYVGEVTKISINGTTTNGVTVYPVTIRIDETEGLLPGMNVDASIDVVNKENVLSVPISAVARGNRVLVKKQGSSNTEGEKEPKKDKNSNESPLEGYEYVQVEVGISNDDYIEIISGLKEGDEIAFANQIPSFQNNMNGFYVEPEMENSAPNGGDQMSDGEHTNEGGRP